MKKTTLLSALLVSLFLTGTAPVFAERDLETGVFLSRDPAGFVDGPNVYSYVRQNPWTKFDPEGLFEGSAERAVAGAEARQMVEHFGGNYADRYNAAYSRDRHGASMGASMGVAAVVGVGATIYTGGAVAPYVTSALGSGTAAMLTTAGLSGAAGGIASQGASNVLTGQPVTQNMDKAALFGATLNMGGAVIGQTVQAFGIGMREGTAIGTATATARQAAANGAPGGAANAMVTADGQIFTGLSTNAGGGPISGSVKSIYGSARTTCAETRTLTAMELANANPQGAVSASAAVNIRGTPTGSPMKACDQACAPVLQRIGIGDAVAGTNPVVPPAPRTPVPVVPYRPSEE